MLKKSLSLLAALAVLPAISLAQSYEAGSDYRVLDREQRMTDKPREVVEFFWYGCGGCYAFLPAAENWKEELPEDVAFDRVPAVLNPTWRTHGKAYYVAEALDMKEAMHQVIFDAIHSDRRRLNDQGSLRELFVEHGADAEEFDSAWNSFTVDSQLRRAENLARRFQVSSTPTIIVNGQYATDLGDAGGPDGMVRLGNWLLQKD